MMASASIRRVTVRGVLEMSWDWVPGVAVALASSGVAFLRGQAASQAVIEKEVSTLREDIKRVEGQVLEFEHSTSDEIRQLLEKLGGLVTRIEVVFTEQATMSRVMTKTLDGIATRLEAQTIMLTQHNADIAVLKQRTRNMIGQ